MEGELKAAEFADGIRPIICMYMQELLHLRHHICNHMIYETGVNGMLHSETPLNTTVIRQERKVFGIFCKIYHFIL